MYIYSQAITPDEARQEVDWVMSREDMANFLSSGWLVIDDNDEDDPIDF